MTKNNADNERIKHRYLMHLRSSKGLSEASLDAVAKALHRFEQLNGFRDFRKFHSEQAIAFRQKLGDHRNPSTDKPLSSATMLQTLSVLRAFFVWLAGERGFRSRLKYSDAEYFRMSEKDNRIAKAVRQRPVPTLEQIQAVLAAMPANSQIEMRDRAIIAFTLLTGIRDGALASLKVKHVDMVQQRVIQDAREVKTKFSKTITTWFFPVGGDALHIFKSWFDFLQSECLWGLDDPLFPSTKLVNGTNQAFEVAGLARRHWSNTSPIRSIFREAFAKVGLPNFNPHSFRHTLTHFGQKICQTPEEIKAWSQNLGHSQVMTTMMNYGEVPAHRQAEIIQRLAIKPSVGTDAALQKIAEIVFQHRAV